MSFGLLNALMLLGLAGLAIPPIIHLLNRRRFDIVDWGAMQFLQISETTRRRLLIEELLLMLLRMCLIGVIVLALAAPYLVTPGIPTLGKRSNRDIVLVFDGSSSMGYVGKDGKTPHEAAKEWAKTIVDGLAPGDSVVVLLARQQVVPVLGEPSHDLGQVRDTIANLPPPNGIADMPQALHEALGILEKSSRRPQREVILLSDGQHFGWADEESLKRWKRLAPEVHAEATIQPRIWVVNLDPHRPAHPPNWSLTPLRTTRAATRVGQGVTFRTDLVLRGQSSYQPPYRLLLEIDGRAPVARSQNAFQLSERTLAEGGGPSPVCKLEVPSQADLRDGKVPLAFDVSFAEPGSHVVSVIVEPDPPVLGPDDERIRDRLPIDNRQDFAIEVLPPLPVLLVDEIERPATKLRGADFLRIALSPRISSADEQPPVPATGAEAPKEVAPMLARIASLRQFQADPGLLDRDIEGAGTKPRVLVLSNVPKLEPKTDSRIEEFLAAGGGVLVTLGDKADETYYNKLFNKGQGWLPARLDRVVMATSDTLVSPQPSTFNHTALELFRDAPSGGLAAARLRRWWKLIPPDRTAAARLTNDDPLLVEKSYRGGRVLLCAEPLDESWDSNLRELPAFVVLAHELVNYLANVRPADHNVQPGQALRYPLGRGPIPSVLAVHSPDRGDRLLLLNEPGRSGMSGPHLLQPDETSLVTYENTSAPGPYRLQLGLWPFRGPAEHYVVRPDPREADAESDLAPCTDADWQAVAEHLPMHYVNERDPLRSGLGMELYRQELWWWFLIGVVMLLCGEIWMTRRLVKNRG
jgi:hypothetical protein